MKEFLEDYGEFIALSIVIVPAVLMFFEIGKMIGNMPNFIGG